MESNASSSPGPSRRQAIGGLFAAGALLAKTAPALAEPQPLRVTCLIRYQIDPYQRDAFRRYAEAWGSIIPRCGGHLLGYFLPYEGTNDVAWALIAFTSLAAYELYRARLKADPDAQANLARVQAAHAILREERNFVECAAGTFERPSTFTATP